MQEKSLDVLIEFHTKVRMGDHITEVVRESLERSAADLASYISSRETLERDFVAQIFEFASIEPSNKFLRYTESEFQGIFDMWLAWVDKVRDALND